ncbi:MAG: 5'/3'-nucleotidase SurE [Candidatus Babeliales bacterium]
MKKMFLLLSIVLTNTTIINFVCAKEPRKLNILLTNDDGYHTLEIQALKQTLRDAGHNVFLVAPSSNQSGCGTSVQLSSKHVQLIPLGHQEFAVQSTEIGYIAGPLAGKSWPATPGQCVLVGEELMYRAGCEPDIVLSGPNRGENVSIRCVHSGTVGAAQVARSVCMGRKSLPSIAISINLGANESRIQETAKFVTYFVELLDAQRDDNDQLLPDGVLLNMNIPALQADATEQAPIKGIALCKSGHAVYDTYLKGNTVFRAYDKGDNNFCIDLCVVDYKDTAAHSDNLALAQGYITIVPFMCDFTAQTSMQDINTKLQHLFTQN